MNWDDLRFHLALARQRSLSGAASALGVTHTTVARRLRASEVSLGVRLFDRTPEGFVATSAGAELVAVAERMEEEVLVAEGRVLGGDARLSGMLRASTLDFVFDTFHDVFSSFVQRFPRIRLTLTTETREVSLARRETDVALRLSNTPAEHLVGRRLGRVGFAVYASESLVRQRGRRAGYGAFPWIGRDPRLGGVRLDAWLERNAPGAQVVLRLDGSAMALRRAVQAGLGAHVLPCFYGDATPGLARLGPVHREFGRDLWLVTLRELRETARVRVFSDHVVERFAGMRELLGGDSNGRAHGGTHGGVAS
ncbi:MAG: LysR family transcriptional regulator [Myxococcales bacterium]|nr:LysR family transcriptional regulator [Myxococcales bacterium]